MQNMLRIPERRHGRVAREGPATDRAVSSVDRAVNVLEILARCGQAGISGIPTELGVHELA
jgi:hypothetical protein